MYAVAGRVQDNEIRFLFDLIEDFQHISRDELTIADPVPLRVFTCCHYCFFHDLNAYDFLRYRRHKLGNRPRAAVKVIDNAFLHAGIRQESPCRLIEYFRAPAVGLEEGKRRHLKGKS